MTAMPNPGALPRDAVALRARFVFPCDGPAIPDGVVSIRGETIVDVGRDAPAGVQLVELGNAAIIPGLVNAHVHLEYSDLAAPLGRPAMTFAPWVRLVVEHKRRRGGPSPLAIAQGLAESLRGGVTTAGEIASPGWPAAAFAGGAPSTTVFLELLGRSEAAVAGRMKSAAEHVEARLQASWAAGLSPHATYSVHPEIVRQSVELSHRASVPLAMHVAESPEELELLETGKGPLRDVLVELGVWDGPAPALGLRPLDFMRQLAQAHRALVIHGNYLDDEEVAFAAAHAERLSVVYCPRTHDYFGHARHPLEKLLSAGARVALGTDGRGSNPDLLLLEDLRAVARRHPGVTGDTVLRLGGEATGSIALGKAADLAIVPLPDRDEADPHALLLDSSLPVAATLQRGVVVSGRDRLSVPLAGSLREGYTSA
jgi:cytosine/adenosine deaminase-related metal-dependent hydrolase